MIEEEGAMVTLSESVEILKRRIQKVNAEIAFQQKCEHPLWVLLDDGSDDYEQRPFWTCRCVVCKKYARSISRAEFQDKKVIIGPYSFETIHQTYLKNPSIDYIYEQYTQKLKQPLEIPLPIYNQSSQQHTHKPDNHSNIPIDGSSIDDRYL